MIVVWYDCISLLVTVYTLALCTRQQVLVTSHILWCPASFAPPNLYLLPPSDLAFCPLLLHSPFAMVPVSHHENEQSIVVSSLTISPASLTRPYKCVWMAHTNVIDWPIQMCLTGPYRWLPALTPTSYNLLVPNPLILLEINQPS